MYRKPTFTRQYLKFNSCHPYNVKKGIDSCLQHRAKAISCDIDAHQEEMISLRHNLHRNNYPGSITPAPRNLNRTIENDPIKLTSVCLPYVKGVAERIQKICSRYDIRTIFTVARFFEGISRVKPPAEFNMTKSCVYSNACRLFVAASHQTRLDTRSKARRPIKVGIKGWGGRERAETRTLLVNAAHRVT